MSEQIKNILTNLKPKEEKKEAADREKEQNIKVISNIQIDNRNHLLAAILIVTILFSSFMLSNREGNLNIGTAFLSQKQSDVLLKSAEDNKITNQKALNLKQLVKMVSKCERRHINTIHSELKREFNYHSYRDINLSTYKKIIEHLNKRTCGK